MRALTDVLSLLDVKMAYEHAKRLTDIAPQRLSGSPEARRAAEYLADSMRKYGLETTVYEFDAYVSFPGQCELSVVEPEKKGIEAVVAAQSASTPPEGLTGEVVYVGSGAAQDYEGKDVRGKIALAELSYAPPRPEKVRLATEHGARALVIMNWGLPEHDSLSLGTVKAVWGNPTPENFDSLPRIPAVNIRRADGEYLRRLLERGQVTVYLKAECIREWRTIELPFGIVRGSEYPEEYILLSGHFDSWGGGVTCNATGNGIMLELARVFSAVKDSLLRSVAVAFWPGHETGIMEGSTWFVDSFWDELREKYVANITIDSPGMAGATHWSVAAAREMHDFLAEVEREVIPEKPIIRRGPWRVGDQSFFGIGIPSMFAYSVHSPEVVKRWGGAILGWWYHSWNDTFDKVDLRVLEQDLRVYASYAYRLANARVLPFNFLPVLDDILGRLRELEDKAPGCFGFDALIRKCEAAKEVFQRLEDARKAGPGTEDRVDKLNRTLMKLSRVLTHATCTVSGRYGQDTYGLTALNYSLPALFPVERYAQVGAKSTEGKLLWTKIIRERNRLSDALADALEVVSSYLTASGL